MTRAVLDANVLVSAILSPKGAPAKVLTAWQAEQFHLVLSEAVLDEIDRVLHYPRIATRHRWSEERLQGLPRMPSSRRGRQEWHRSEP